ncbi:NtaA/DmoA family FMN-dependent monooxygenase [Rhodococcus sp. NPDC003318]|uniref:NtaA/DmoA family FMN-dependent monooxygenase n=1 Tax=Rhodococcus sp. NPDC003318 TaxID=3364503 RepID=UPI00369CE6B7
MSSHEPPRQLLLGALLNGAGHHEGGWRLPGSRAEEIYSLSLYQHLARLAEDAKLHFLFAADSPSQDLRQLRLKAHRNLEPLTLLTALTASTENIGLIGTFTTSYYEPYNLARQLNSLDILSGGRTGWNIVTSHSGAENFTDQPHLEHGLRYRRAEEYVRLTKALWDGWDRDALTADRATGLWVDTDKVRAADFHGEFLHSQGPLNLPPSPQRWPVLVQAGASTDGKELAAAHAELVYTASSNVDAARAWAEDLRDRVEARGRARDSIKVMLGVAPVVAETDAEAQRILDELDDFIDDRAALPMLEKLLGGVDLSGLDLDERIPEELLPETSQVWVESRYRLLRGLAVDEGFSVRKLIRVAQRGGGHWSPVGSVERVADQMEEWFRAGAADGFNFLPLYNPAGLEAITTLLVPELVRRGLFRSEYEGATLRENLGLTALEH